LDFDLDRYLDLVPANGHVYPEVDQHDFGTPASSSMREVKAGSAYASQNDTRVHFGLGPAEQIDGFEIRWPSGKVQKRQKLKADQILVVQEGSGDDR
jgi:ASPIC and UnbV